MLPLDIKTSRNTVKRHSALWTFSGGLYWDESLLTLSLFTHLCTVLGWEVAFSTRTEKPSEMVRCLLQEVIPRFRFPASIGWDNSPDFIADLTQQVCKVLNQFSSVAQSCLTLCDPMDCSTPGLPVHHQLMEFTQTHVHWVGDAIPTISSSVTPFCSRLHSFPASWSFRMSQFLTSGGQSVGVSASASALQWIFRTEFL